MYLPLSDSDQEALSGKNALHFRREVSSTQGAETNNIAPDDHINQQAIQITSNMWPRKRMGKEMRNQANRSSIHGVEMRSLDASHILAGQTGLFAAMPFMQFDIIGEYCGEVVSTKGAEYKAVLEQKEVYPLSLDAQKYGNECRAINHYENIGPCANVIMRICYVEELPRIMIVCKGDVGVGEEFLLDYGDAYVNAFLRGEKEPKEPNKDKNVEWSEMAGGD